MDKSKAGKRSRDRGKRGELELVHILRDDYGYTVRRGYVFHGESDLVGLEGIHVECKYVEKLNIHKAMGQAVAEADKRKDGLPTVFFRRNGGEWLVCQKLTDWIDLYGAWVDEEGLDQTAQEDGGQSYGL